tara:strand:- start:61 stop:570 length:510 start_codon:yes stop_codon:yes gene_type:complete
MSGDPVTLMVMSTVVSAVGQIAAGSAANSAAKYNAAVARNQAISARQTAAENAKRQNRIGKKRQGAARAIDPDKLDLLEDSAMEEALAEKDIIHGGEVDATGFENTARLEIAKGKNAMTGAVIGAGSSLLMGGAVAGGFGGGGGSFGPGSTTGGHAVGRGLRASSGYIS